MTAGGPANTPDQASELWHVGRLDDLVRVRREMRRVYRAGLTAALGKGPLGVEDATRLAGVLSRIGRLIADGELERRIEELERQARERMR